MSKTLATNFINAITLPKWQRMPIDIALNKANAKSHSIMYSQVDFIKHFYDKSTPKEHFEAASGYMVAMYIYHHHLSWFVGDFFYRAVTNAFQQQFADYPDTIGNVMAIHRDNAKYFNRYYTIRHINKAYSKHGNYGDDTDFEFYMLKYYKFLFLSLEALSPFADEKTNQSLQDIFYNLSLGYSYLYDVQMYSGNAFIIDVFPKLYKYQWLNHIPLIRRPLTYSALCAKHEFKHQHGINTFMYSNLALEPYLYASDHYLRLLNKAEYHLSQSVALSDALEQYQQSKTKRLSNIFQAMVDDVAKMKQKHHEDFKEVEE